MSLTFGSLFAGIGGIDLGLERAGWECRWQVEWDPFCQHVLAHHWPDVPRHGDITRVDWSAVEPVDLIAGGFPCQPVSIAGRQQAQDDDRWLWPEFARAVRELRPRYVLVENVRNLLAVNGGRAFGEVVGDLAALGYDAEWHVVSAADVGAPHLRERVWIVARSQQRRPLADADDGRPRDAVRAGRNAARDGGPHVADAERERLEAPRAHDTRPGQQLGARAGDDGAEDRGPAGRVPHAVLAGLEGSEREVLAGARDGRPDADPAGSGGRPAQPRMGRVADGLPAGLDGHWDVEPPDVPRVARNVPHRVDRLRALGNAVVPQVVEVIGRRLMAAAQEDAA